MKRRLRHLAIGILAVAAGVGLASRRLHQVPRSDEGFALPDAARARLSVLLDADAWTEFRVPPGTIRVKLVSRANLRGDPDGLGEREFPYQLEYQLESGHGDVEKHGRLALAGLVIPSVDGDGRPASSAFLQGTDLTPTSARASILELEPGGANVLKLRAPSAPSPIADVSVRMFTRGHVSDENLFRQWSRLSPVGRARISRARVHDLVDLTPAEIRSIMQNRWEPLGPEGIAGRDYRERTQYLRDDLVPAKRRLIEPLAPGEIRCGQQLRAVFGIPSPGGRVRLAFRRRAGAASATAQIRFFGESLSQRSVSPHRIDRDRSTFVADVEPGLLEIESPVAVAVRAFLIDDADTEQLLEPDPTIVRTWCAGVDQAVTFPLGGNRDRRGFFRLAVRPVSPYPTTVHIACLNPGGAEAYFAAHAVASTTSLYDQLLTVDGQEPVNDPVDLVLAAPEGVTAIRIHADAEVLLGGYARPADLVHRTRVPADYVRALPDPQRLPVWFSLRPDQADELIRAHRSQLIHIQPRPPEDDADILAGNYQWEDYQPLAGARGQYILYERDPHAPTRPQALPSLYMPLVVGVDQPLALANPPGLDLPQRRLAFVRDGNEPTRLRIRIDGAEFHDRDLVAARGELLLPPIPPTSRTIRIDSDAAGLECFLNYVQPAQATRLKRLTQRIAPGTSLSFLCRKETDDDELLTAMLFSSTEVPTEAEIRASILPAEGGGFMPVSERFTLRKRHFVITPDPDTQALVLGGTIPGVDGGRRFFIPLRGDLLPGTYQVVLSLQRGGDGYLSLSKVTGGDYTDARFFLETGR